jgi:hypothetical protein
MNEYSGGNYLVYKSSFLATRVITTYLEPVEFELEIGFQFGPTEAKTASDYNNEQTIAYNKLEFFVEHVLNKSIFVSQHNGFWHEIASLETSNNYVIFHQDPYDDLITKYLYYKMQAISFPAFMMVDLSVWSSSSKLKFNFVGEEKCSLPSITDNIGKLAYHTQPWYHRDDCDTRDQTPTTKKDLDNPPENSVSFDIIFELLSSSENIGEIVDIQKKFKPTIV